MIRRAKTTHLFPVMEVVAERKFLVVKSDRPWECHFFPSLSFLNCMKGVTNLTSHETAMRLG